MASLMAQQKAGVFAKRQVAARNMAPMRPVARKAVTVRAACSAPLVGNKAPDFKAQAVIDMEFKEVSLSQYKGKYVVLFF